MMTKLFAAGACIAVLAAASESGKSFAARELAEPLSLRLSIPVAVGGERHGRAWLSATVGGAQLSAAAVWSSRRQGGRLDVVFAREVTAASVETPERPNRDQVTGS